MTAMFTALVPGSDRGVRRCGSERNDTPLPLRQPCRRVSRIDDHPGESHHALVIDYRVIGDDDDGVRTADRLVGKLDTLVLVSVLTELCYVRIMVLDSSTLILEKSDHVESGTLAHVVDVPLVCDSQHENPASVDRLLFLVERLSDLAHHDGRHLTVDLAGEIDEAGLVVQGPHLPG